MHAHIHVCMQVCMQYAQEARLSRETWKLYQARRWSSVIPAGLTSITHNHFRQLRMSGTNACDRQGVLPLARDQLEVSLHVLLVHAFFCVQFKFFQLNNFSMYGNTLAANFDTVQHKPTVQHCSTCTTVQFRVYTLISWTITTLGKSRH